MNFFRSSISIERNGSVAKARSASAMLSNQTSPTPSQSASSRRPAVDHAEAQAAQARQLADDVGVRAGPVGEELLAGQAVLAADEADALDHDGPPSGAVGRWNSSSVMPSWMRR